MHIVARILGVFLGVPLLIGGMVMGWAGCFGMLTGWGMLYALVGALMMALGLFTVLSTQRLARQYDP